MDLNAATQAHSEWKVKLRVAITRKERLDAVTIGKDNCCALGQWLHGEGKQQFAKYKTFGDCLTRHATFHREAGAVAQTINSGDYAKANAMLEGGTPFAAASSSVVAAISALKKELAPA